MATCADCWSARAVRSCGRIAVGPNATAATSTAPRVAASARREAGTTTARVHAVIHRMGRFVDPAGCRAADFRRGRRWG